MFKNIYKSILLWLSLFSTCHAMDADMPHVNNFVIMSEANLEDVFEAVKNLINTPVLGDEIILICDLDGTLTDRSEPSLNHPVKPRENAVEFLHFADNNKVNTFISSAWDIFAETLYRVDKLGLSPTFNTTSAVPLCHEIDEFIENTDTKRDFKGRFSNTLLKSHDILKDSVDISKTIGYLDGVDFNFLVINYCHLGNVVSIRDTDQGSFTPQYYRNKAFSPLIARPDLDYGKIKHVIFVDDNSGNIECFIEDIKHLQEIGIMKFDKSVKIHVFELKFVC